MSRLDDDVAQVLMPGRCALLVIDMQNDFIHPDGWSERHGGTGGPPLRRVIPVINELIRAARAASAVVVYVVMEHGPAVDAPNYAARYGARGMNEHILCETGTWGAELDGELDPPEPGDHVVVRHTYDGFARTDLDALLKSHGVETCVAAGVVTNLCVQTTIQHAFALGYFTALVADGTAAGTALEHDVTLDAFRRFFGPVVTGADLVVHWRARAV